MTSTSVPSALAAPVVLRDARRGFATSTGGAKTTIIGLPWSIGRQTPETTYAFQRGVSRGCHWRFELKAADLPGSSAHCELQPHWAYVPSAFDGTIPVAQEFWQAWSFYVEPGAASQTSWAILGQWHATEDSPINTAPDRLQDDALSPILAFDLKPGDLFAVTSRTSSPARQLVSQFPTERIEYQVPTALSRGAWHHIVVNGQFGWASDGKLAVWLDGAKVIDLSQYSIGYNDEQGPHFQFGVYRGYFTPATPRDPSGLAVRYANMEYSTSSLIDRVTSPLAT